MGSNEDGGGAARACNHWRTSMLSPAVAVMVRRRQREEDEGRESTRLFLRLLVPHHQPAMLLTALPPELQLQIITFTDFATLAAFSRLSRSAHSLTTDSLEHLCRALCILHGFAEGQTFSSSCLRSWMEEKSKGEDPGDQRWLRIAVKAQNSMGSYYEDATTWFEFGE
jgi:hypothetical protein